MTLKAGAAELRGTSVVAGDERSTRKRRAGVGAEMLRVNRGGGTCCGGSHLRALSPREREAFLHIVAGRTIREISVEMSIRPKTAENYRQRVLEKLGVHCAIEAVHYAVCHGFLAAHARNGDDEEGAGDAHARLMSSMRHGRDAVVPPLERAAAAAPKQGEA